MTQYCGIIITDTELYVSVSKRIQNKIKVIDRYIHKRTESLTIDLSTIHSKNTNVSILIHFQKISARFGLLMIH